MSASLEGRLVASITLAKVKGLLRGIGDCIHDYAAELEQNGHRNDVLYGFADSVRETLRMLERFEREEIRALLEGRS